MDAIMDIARLHDLLVLKIVLAAGASSWEG